MRYNISMKVGDIVQTEILSQGMEGEGVARIDGQVCFVPLTLAGEVVRVQITQVKKDFLRAKVIKLLTPSKDRITPDCPAFFRCGGCGLRHMPYDAELKLKREKVETCMKKAGIGALVEPVFPSPPNARNKAQVPFAADEKGKVFAGYFKRDSHKAIPLPECGCPQHDERTNSIIRAAVNVCNTYNIPAYDEQTGRGVMRHILVRRIGAIYSVCLVINADNLPHADKFISSIAALGIQFSLSANVNKRNTNVITGDTVLPVYGDIAVKGEICGVKTEISPLSFMQVNDEICTAIYGEVKALAEALRPDTVLDGYGGVGIISNLLAPYCKTAYCVEIVPSAVENGKKTALMNGNSQKIQNVLGDAAKIIPSLNLGENCLAVLDPPRKGCDSAVLQALLSAMPGHIVYISCNPATLARDLRILTQGYDIKLIRPYDMFPRTFHVETLAVLERKNEENKDERYSV